MITRKVNNKTYYLPDPTEKVYKKVVLAGLYQERHAPFMYSFWEGISQEVKKYYWKRRIGRLEILFLKNWKLAFDTEMECEAHEFGAL